MNSLVRSIRDILYESGLLLAPAMCKLCGTSLARQESGICVDCLESLPRTSYFRKTENEMTDRFAGRFPLVSATALLRYKRDNPVAVVVKEFKYYSSPGLARSLGELLGRELLMWGGFFDVDCIVPVPVHFLKRMKRGYNQTEEICKGISRSTGVAMALDLRAVRPHATQTRKSLEERRSGSGPHLFATRHPERLAGKHILLVDDVCTTGSTIAGAAGALLRDVPGLRISVAALAATDL